MMAGAMARRLLGGAREAAAVAAGLAKHVLWYVSYRVDGTSRDGEPVRRSRSDRS